MDPIVKSTHWTSLITVNPSSGQTNADVTTALTGATVAVILEFGGLPAEASPTGAVESAASRTIRLTITAANTALLTAREGYRLDVRITTSGALVYPVRIAEHVSVRSEPYE